MYLSSLSWSFCYLSEENVWKLCETFKNHLKIDLSQFYVVFISNEMKQIPLWYQKASDNPLSPVVWDYHVILIYNKGKNSLVYDLDTTLSFPCYLCEYAEKVIQSENDFGKNFSRKFRVIPASSFLQTFASDRSHMLTEDGKWRKPPPSYPPIRTQDTSMNLFEYIDMNPQKGEGTVMDLNNFLKNFQVQLSTSYSWVEKREKLNQWTNTWQNTIVTFKWLKMLMGFNVAVFMTNGYGKRSQRSKKAVEEAWQNKISDVWRFVASQTKYHQRIKYK